MARSGDDSTAPLVADYERSWQDAMQAGLVGRSKEPLNCELPPAMLGGEVTATRQFFRRNHFPIPELDAGSWRLEVSGLVREPLSLSLPQLRGMPSDSVMATLECAGNGRDLFSPPVPGERWGLGAVSNARWTGVRLREVLDQAGLLPGAREAVFRGADGGRLPDVPEPIRYERSLSVGDIEASGALLAYEMNDEPLPTRHGFPVRLIVPGWYAMASVKWLTEIVVTSTPFRGFFQDAQYVYEWQRHGRPEREPVRLQRVRAIVADPAAGQQVSGGDLVVSGVAWSGTGPVTQVDVRVEALAVSPMSRWQPARLVGPASRHGWQRWELHVADLPPGPALIGARATDAAGHDQRATPEWNERGYGGNFIHEVAATAM